MKGSILKRQGGNGTILGMAMLAVLAVGGIYYQQTRVDQLDNVAEDYKSTAIELQQLTGAIVRYYRDTLSWPTSLNELKTAGYFDGDTERCGGAGTFQSPLCTLIEGLESGENYQLSVNLLKPAFAKSVANQIPGGRANGSIVTATIKRPYQTQLHADYLQRFEDPDHPSATKMETSINVNGNELNNIGVFNADTVSIVDATINTATFTDLTTEKATLGDNSITYSGNTLQMNAGTVEINGDLSLNGNATANGNDLLAVGLVQGNEGDFEQLTANTGTINQLSGDTLAFGEGSIDTLSGTSLNFGTGTVSNLQGDTLNFGTGNIGTLSGSSLNYSSGSVGNVSGNTLTYGTGTVNDLTGSSLDVGSGTFGTVTATNGQHSSLTVTGYSSFGSFGANSATIDDITSSSWNFSNGEFNNLQTDSATVTGTANITDLNSSRIQTNSGSATTLRATSGSATGNVSASSVSANQLVVNNRLTTGSLQSNNSSLGQASASSFGVSGTLTAQGINTSTFSANNGNVTNVSGTTLNYSTITANQFNGGNFNSNDDFYTSVSSVNKNYIELTDQKARLDNCMNVSKFCIPAVPNVGINCSGCVASSTRSQYSATASATVNECRQGCSYSWRVVGSGISVQSCNAGTVAAGSSATPSCSFGANVGPQETVSGSVSIVVTNQHYTNQSSSASSNISFTNRTPLGGVSTASLRFSSWYDSGYNHSFSGDLVYPLINGKEYSEWGTVGCGSCSWSVSVSNDNGSCSVDMDADWSYAGIAANKRSGSVEFSVDTDARPGGYEGYVDCRADADVSLTITDAASGQSRTFNFRANADMSESER